MEIFMRRALELAAQGAGFTAPNPMVGAVIVKNGHIVGEGWHQKAGTPHAEIHALNMAGNYAAGATLYVTLEPCCNFGKTPPCTEALIQAGITKVVAAVETPDPNAKGKGFKRLREAGVEVEVGLLAEEVKMLNEVFWVNQEKKRPFVALKVTASVDGKIATYQGISQWITGEESRKHGQQLRWRYGAVLTGIGTIMAYHPQMTTECLAVDCVKPKRIILDSHLKIDPANYVCDVEQTETWIYTFHCDSFKRSKLEKRGVKVLCCPEVNGRIDFKALLYDIYQKGVVSVVLEAGAQLNGAFFDQKLIDKLYLYFGPMLIGGNDAQSLLGGQGIATLQDAVELAHINFQKIGKDWLVTGYPQWD